MSDILRGTVERVTFTNGENGFAVFKFKAEGWADLITAVGVLTGGLSAGTSAVLEGEWKFDPKFGRQFAVIRHTEIVPATEEGIEKYLGSGLIKGIGPVNAARIVRKFGTETIDIIENHPERLGEVEGLGSKKAKLIKAAWQSQREVKNIMIFLQGHGVSPAYAAKIYKTYGGASVSVVKSNPYKLADDIWGIGFKTADRIAETLGLARDSFDRCKAGIIFTLNGMAEDGHCYAEFDRLLEQAESLLGVERDILAPAAERLIMDGSLIRDEDGGVYLPVYYHSETGTAQRLSEIFSQPVSFDAGDTAAAIAAVEAEQNITYDAIQKDAVACALRSKVTVMTGGPGTGKTTTTLAIISVFRKLGASVLLAAPTGRAAKRMSEAAGMEARTIHRLLEYSMSDGYARNRDNQLDCDVLIIDEASMVDILLAFNLLKAVKDSTVLILVGDVDQLPSVGPGNVLGDIIDSGAVPVVKLTRIFRQAEGSDIVTNAHMINRGEFPQLGRSGKDGDFFFIEEEDPAKAAEIVRDLCVTRLPKYYGADPVSDIQILCPMIRGETGTANLNRMIREALNPLGAALVCSGTEFRERDKVMQIKNNYEKNIFNGDIGTITHVDTESGIAVIDFNGTPAEYETGDLDEVALAYAATVHKSQGSEYGIVILPFSTQHYMMLQRNLLYTALTRAKKAFVLVGTKKAVAMAVANNKTNRRNTALARRLADRILPDRS